MIKNITIGQYFPGKSFMHRMDARVKLVLVLAFVIYIFVCKNFWSLGLCALVGVSLFLSSRISPLTVLKGLRLVVVLILFTSLMQLFYNSTGDILLEWHKLRITTGGVFTAIFMAVRIILLILVSSLLTYTTSPTMLTDAMERLLSPLKIFHVKVGELAMMMTIALRFIPTLIDEVNRIMNAQKARGADFETGSFISRAKALVPVFIPLFVNSFRRAFDLANAMECRCYTGSENRTRLKVMKLALADYFTLAGLAVLLAGIILLNIYFPALI